MLHDWLNMNRHTVFFFIAFFAINCMIIFSCSAAVSDPLQEVNIIYHDNFPCSKINCQIPVPGCHKVLFDNIPEKENAVLRCAAHAQLLRSKSTIEQWKYTESLKGYFPFTMQEFGINNTEAHIISVKALELNNKVIKTGSGRVGLITGLFERKSMDIRSYRFQELRTGKLSTVHVTPGHRFYVKNRKSFVPVADISYQDELLDVRGSVVNLVHPDKISSYHEQPLYKGKSITSVYNLEVSGNHTYFAGKANLLLVHNACHACNLCDFICHKEPEFEAHMHNTHGIEKPFKCEFKGCSKQFKTLKISKQHYINAHSKIEFKCRDTGPKCRVIYKNLKSFRTHVKNRHNATVIFSDPDIYIHYNSPPSLSTSPPLPLPPLIPSLPTLPLELSPEKTTVLPENIFDS